MRPAVTDSPAPALKLGFRQVYILPTRYGLLFGLLILVLLLASINYGNGLAYGLTFLLASLALVSSVHTQRNLLGLALMPGGATPVFAGQNAEFDFCLHNASGRPRWGLVVEQDLISTPGRRAQGKSQPRPVARVEIPAGDSGCARVSLAAPRRGRLQAPRCRVATRYPLALFYAWSPWVEADRHCIVYPRPAEPDQVTRRSGAQDGDGTGGGGRGGDDFTGLREYRPGDSLRHVHWKAVARGQGWHTKEFGGGGVGRSWLDWTPLDGFDPETRLSILTRWVLDAERDGDRYGLRLPGRVIEPGSGEAHERACLTALALFRP